MADVTATTPIHISNPILRALSWIWNGLIHLGESSAKARTIEHLNRMSDEELAQLGWTRQDMVRRIMSDGFYL